ncbi:MAG: hypothetical protein WD232_01430 [Acidimicrobiales bacterium]
MRADWHQPHPDRLDPERRDHDRIMAAHDAAVAAGEPGYTDPSTGGGNALLERQASLEPDLSSAGAARRSRAAVDDAGRQVPTLRAPISPESQRAGQPFARSWLTRRAGGRRQLPRS